jgi:hypothetical protein
MSTESSPVNARWIAPLITVVLLSIWVVGLGDAIIGGLNPGYVRNDIAHPYPVCGVLVTCGFITAESSLLFAILHPFSLFCTRRVLIALAVFGSLCIADFILVSAWTDQAGYYYSNGFFLRLTVFSLIIVAIICGVVFHRQARNNADYDRSFRK